jgi:ABC-type sulfate transport system permease component
MIKTAILAGAIMVFMRSLGETGATVVVMGLIRTVPVGIIDYAESIELEAAAFSSFVIILISFVLIFVLRYLSGEEREEPLIKRGLTYA